MCECQKYIVPDERLKRMITFVIIMALINLALGITRGIFFGLNYMLYDLISCLMLFLAIQTLLYIYMSVFLFIAILNAFIVFVLIGIVVQQVIGGGQLPVGNDAKENWGFGINVFAFVYYIFGIITLFPIYREMKAQLVQGYANQADPERPADQQPVSGYNPPSSQNVSNNQGGSSQPSTGFRAFSGRGQVLGGN